MLKSRAFPMLAVLALFVACGESTDPVSPEAAAENPELVSGTADAGALVEEGTGVFTFDDIVFFDCVGENVRSIVYAPYTYRLIQMPSGGFVYQETWDTGAVTGTLIGQTSGIVWDRTNNVAPFIERSTGGGSGMIHYTFKGDFESDVGPDLKVHEVFHLSWNASGELVAAFYKPKCVQK